MANNLVNLPVDYFPDPSKGKPLSFAQIFIGIKDLDPEIEANRKTIVFKEEDGTETTILPAAQPLLLFSPKEWF